MNLFGRNFASQHENLKKHDSLSIPLSMFQFQLRMNEWQKNFHKQ